MSDFRKHIERAIALKGSQAQLARELGCSQQNISWLLTKAKRVPLEIAVEVERVTRGEVTVAQLTGKRLRLGAA